MSSPYPIVVTKTRLHFKSGSSDKEYHLVRIVCANGNAMLIKRWGKTATWGQMDVLTGTGTAATRDRIWNEKVGKGYEQTHHVTEEAQNYNEFSALVPGYLKKLTPEQIAHVLGDTAPDKGVREGFKPTAPAEPPPPPPSEAERYAANPLWGAFS